MTHTARTLICPGELRPDIMQLVGVPSGGLDCLLAAPGLLEPWEGYSTFAQVPSCTISSRTIHLHRDALLRDLNRAIDRLPRTSTWQSSIRGWISGIAQQQIRIRHLEGAALYTRLISTGAATFLPQAPITQAIDAGTPELRIELTGAQHDRARAWFEQIFLRGTALERDVGEALQSCWAAAKPTSEELYYKTLSEYFRDVVDGIDTELDDNPLLEHLTEFQRDAYVYARTILRRYGGVFLADVVGLGKTFIAFALLADLQRRQGLHPVIVAPPAVLPTWKALAGEFRVEAALISSGKLDDLKELSDRELLVIDESHNFRNTRTLRYETIHEWLRPDGAPSSKKVILLSATPQNNRADDVKNQLKLFPDNHARLPFRGDSLDEWFRSVSTGQASLAGC